MNLKFRRSSEGDRQTTLTTVRCFAPIIGWLASERMLRNKCHLGEIADLTALSIRAFLNVCELMATSDALDGWIAEEANISL
jgi:hypothetical protein